MLLATYLAVFSGHLLAQTTSGSASDGIETPAAKVKNVLDEHLLPSARGAALSGALVTTADNLDAAVYNPAGIGGLDWGKQKVPMVRKLYFPWVAASANQNSANLSQDFNGAGGNNDRAVGKSVLAAHAGKRQYARANLLSGIVWGRTLLVPINDVQVAATAQEPNGDTPSQLVDGHSRMVSGVGGGFSAQSTDGNLSLGYFGYSVTRSEMQGVFSYDDMLETQARNQALNAAKSKHEGSGHSAGIIWKLGKAWSPTLGIAVREIGDTNFISKTDGVANQKVAQNTSLGFSLGPSFKSGGGLVMTLQFDRLADADVSLAKKYRFGTELALGGSGSHATFALRAGASQAGPSGGLALNLGLIGFDAGVQSIDIGAGNQRVTEMRAVADAYVNVAEF